MHEWHVASLPTIVTHDLVDDAGDEVLQQLRYLDLVNRAEDPVKVVYHPDFIAPSSPLFGMDYDDFVRGCHLGIFPSFYEPWGYTPLECVARGVPAVTSDLSGFGTYVRECVESPEQRGVYVLGRNHRSFDDAAAELAELLLGFCRMDRRERIDLRNRVESHAAQFDWSRMWENYARVYRRLEQMHPAG
jgi:glycogen(starch) synthase